MQDEAARVHSPLPIPVPSSPARMPVRGTLLSVREASAAGGAHVHTHGSYNQHTLVSDRCYSRPRYAQLFATDPLLASNIIHRLTFLLCPSLSSPSVHYALPFMIPFMLLAVLKIPRRARFLPCAYPSTP